MRKFFREFFIKLFIIFIFGLLPQLGFSEESCSDKQRELILNEIQLSIDKLSRLREHGPELDIPFGEPAIKDTSQARKKTTTKEEPYPKDIEAKAKKEFGDKAFAQFELSLNEMKSLLQKGEVTPQLILKKIKQGHANALDVIESSANAEVISVADFARANGAYLSFRDYGSGQGYLDKVIMALIKLENSMGQYCIKSPPKGLDFVIAGKTYTLGNCSQHDSYFLIFPEAEKWAGKVEEGNCRRIVKCNKIERDREDQHWISAAWIFECKKVNGKCPYYDDCMAEVKSGHGTVKSQGVGSSEKRGVQ